jgi:hypothetical protein
VTVNLVAKIGIGSAFGLLLFGVAAAVLLLLAN